MPTKKTPHGGMNVCGCPDNKCDGIAFVPINRERLARMRVHGEVVQAVGSCYHLWLVEFKPSEPPFPLVREAYDSI